MRARRRPAVALALGAATLLLLTGIAPAAADDPASPDGTAAATTDAASGTEAGAGATAEPEPTPESEPTPENERTESEPPESELTETESTPEGGRGPASPTGPGDDPAGPAEPAEHAGQPEQPEQTGQPEQTADAAATPTGIVVDPRSGTTRAGVAVGYEVWTIGAQGMALTDVTDEAVVEFVGDAGSCAAGSCLSTSSGLFPLKATWGGFTAFNRLRVAPGEPTGIILRPATATVGVGGNRVFEAKLADQYGNRVDDADEVDFTPDPGLYCTTETASIRCWPTAPGTYTITANLRSDPTRTATSTLVGEPGDDALAGISVDPRMTTVAAGAPVPLVVQGLTTSGHDVDVTDRATVRAWPVNGNGVPDLTAERECPAATCTFTDVGRYRILVTVAGSTLTADAEVEVVPAAPVGLVLDPAEAAVTAGTTHAFQAALVDAHGNRIPAEGATYTIEAPGTCAAGACTSATPGTYVVTAHHDGRSAAATLRVHADTRPTQGIARIEVAPTAPSVLAGEPGTFVVRAYGPGGEPLGTVTDDATLTIEGAGTWRNGIYGERRLTCSADTCTSTVVGEHAVTARFGELTATTTMVVVSDGSGVFSGLAPANAVISAGETQTFLPGLMDRYGNLVEVSATFGRLELRGSAGVTCTGQVCGSTKAGAYLIAIKSVNGMEVDEETAWLFAGVLTVVPGPVDRIGIDPASVTVPAGESAELTTTAYDAYDNVVADVTDETDLVAAAGATCTTGRCTSTVAATYPVTGTYDGKTADAQLRVVPGPVDEVVVSPGTASIRTGETQTFTTTGLDAFGNEVGDLTEATTFTVSEPGTCAANACGSGRAGELTVTGSYVVPAPPLLQRLASDGPGAAFAAPGDTVTGTATLTVTAPGTPGPGTTGPGAGSPGGGTPGDDGTGGAGGKGGSGKGGPGGTGSGPGTGAGGQGAGAGDAGALPATGSEVTWWHGLVAALLLLAGLAVVGTSRRRHAR
ncbi:LPXTG cell wall anchor domain-containing protein [Nocardioides sp. BYT-33-1]|uniref:LPXTG cell wall anchor domain-containing protein n=1 Tax=Nocardioides sp. BYT-33-1 TaxID=3416952 RepID=UPI003F53AB45